MLNVGPQTSEPYARVLERDTAQARCPICGGPLRVRGFKAERATGELYRYTVCIACGFLFVNPRPTPRALAEWYRRGDSPREVGSWDTLRNNPRVIAEASVDPARLIPWGERRIASGGRRMFDVGAGLGLFSREALARGMEVTALELDEHAAQELERALGIPVLRLPFEDYRADASFDLIVLNQVLEHAHDPVDWACRLQAALRTGGVVVLGMPHGRSFWQRMLGLADPYVKPPLHLNHFSRRSLMLLLERAGLRVVVTRTYSRLPWNLVSRKAHLPRSLRPLVDRVFCSAQQVPLGVLDRLGMGIMLEVCARREA